VAQQQRPTGGQAEPGRRRAAVGGINVDPTPTPTTLSSHLYAGQ